MLNGINACQVGGNCGEPVLQVYLEFCVQDEHTQWREGHGYAIILDHIEIHSVHYKRFVLQREHYWLMVIFACRFR